MDKQSIIKEVHNRLYWMGSNLSPSIEDVNLYGFLDRAYHLVINTNVTKGSLEHLNGLIETKNNFTKAFKPIKPIKHNRYVKYDTNFLDDFFLFLGGTILLSRDDLKYLPVALEQVSAKYFEVLTDTTNKVYFRNPKIIIGNGDDYIFVINDYFSTINNNTTDSLVFRYIKVPQKFENLLNNQEPEIPEILQFDLIEKAAELIANTLNPQMAAQEIQNNDKLPL